MARFPFLFTMEKPHLQDSNHDKLRQIQKNWNTASCLILWRNGRVFYFHHQDAKDQATVCTVIVDLNLEMKKFELIDSFKEPSAWFRDVFASVHTIA